MQETVQEVTKLLVFTDDVVWKTCFHKFDAERFSVLILDDRAGALTDALLFHPHAICVSYSFFIKSGLSFLDTLISATGGIPVILLSDTDDLTISKWILEQGGYVISASPDPVYIERKITDCIKKAPVLNEKPPVMPDLEPFDSFIGETDEMRSLKLKAARYAKSNLPVLITGETGTGKTSLAEAIHNASERRGKPFLTKDMGTVREELAESTLFGQLRHAYTDSDDRAGLFEAASGGTVFLDEITESSLAVQAKLLRVLGQGKIQRVGATAETAVDVRLISATNRNLADEVAAHRFREDLYYRIGHLSLEIPPLRNRIEDIPLLISFFLKGRNKSISRGAMEKLLSHTWPGNVRELCFTLEAAFITGGTNIITESDITFLPR